MCGKEAGKGGRYTTCRGLRLVIFGRIVARLLLKVLYQGFLYIYIAYVEIYGFKIMWWGSCSVELGVPLSCVGL